MSLTKPSIPPHITRAFTSGLGDFIDASESVRSLLAQDFMAIEAYNLMLTNPLPKSKTDWILDQRATISSGWRFWAARGDLYGACHVGNAGYRARHSGNAGPEQIGEQRDDVPPKLTGFSRAEQALTDIERFNQLSTIPELAGGFFEPRVLRVTWCPLEAFWLKSIVPWADDQFVAYSGFPPPKSDLEMMKAYTWEELREKLWNRLEQAYDRFLRREAVDKKNWQRAVEIQASNSRILAGYAYEMKEKAEKAEAEVARFKERSDPA